MASYHVENVMVANPDPANGNVWLGDANDPSANFAFTGPLTPVPLNQAPPVQPSPVLLASPGNPPVQPNNLFPGPAPIGNGGAGVLTAIFSATRTTADLTNFPVIPPDIRGRIQFALYDPIRGARLSDIINIRSINYVNQTPYQFAYPHIVTFCPRYSNVAAIPTPTQQGDVLTVKVTLFKDFWERATYSIFASTVVPGGQVGQPATAAQIQAANFQLLENILAADVGKGDNPQNPTGYYFDRILSRQLSWLSNYTQIFLVGNTRIQYPQDNYYMPGPIKFDVHLIEGFGPNPVVEPLATLPGLVAAVGAQNSYLATYIQGTPGSGNYPQVLWSERKSVNQEGHINHVSYNIPQRTNPFTAAQPQFYYDCVTIDYHNKIKVTGENTTKELQKRLTIWYGRNIVPLPALYDAPTIGAALPALPAIYNIANVITGAPGFPAFIAAPQVPAPVAPAALGPASWGPVLRAYVPPAVPAQAANAALFAADNLNNGAGSFIGNLGQQLFN